MNQAPSVSSPQSACVALTEGLPPHAAPFFLEELTGRDSLLGGDFGPLSKTAARENVLPEYSLPAPVYLAGEVTSTFAVAWRLYEDGHLPPWGAVLARRQTEGRGQMRRPWHSPPGNLHVTFRLPDDPALVAGPAALVTGYFLIRAFRQLGFPLLLKWPNDLLTPGGAKAGGILLEERDGILLAGMGINLAEVPDAGLLRREAASPAGTLPIGEAGKLPAPFFLWRSLVERAVVEYAELIEGRGFSELLPDLTPYLAWQGERVAVTDADGTRVLGRYASLSSDGGICIRLDNGRLAELHGGSLSRA